MKKLFKSTLITSILGIVLGLLLLFESDITIISISYIIGGILIAIGTIAILQFIKAINNPKNKIKNDLDIVYGVVCVIMGIIIIKNPKAIASIIPIIIGISIIISSAKKLQYSLELKSAENNSWKMTMVVALISTICGIILLFKPFKSVSYFIRIVGLFTIIYTLLDLISTYSIMKQLNKIKKLSSEVEIKEAQIIDEDDK